MTRIPRWRRTADALGRWFGVDARIAAVLFVLGAACFANTIHGDFVFDDIKLIVNNDIIKDPRRVTEVLFTNLWGLLGRGSNYYRPLPPLLFMTLHALFGMKPEPFHILNITFHAAATSLVFLIASTLLVRAGTNERLARWAAAAGAALFAVHPIHVEAVAWIAGVMDVACTAFSLLAIYLYVTAGEGDRLRRSLLAPAALLLGLFSKEPAAVVPVLLIGYDILFCRKSIASPVDAFRRWSPVFAALTVYVGLRVVALGGLAPYSHVTQGWSLQAILAVPRLVALYAGKLVAPVNLNVIYSIKPSSTVESFLAAVAVLAALGTVGLAAMKAGPVPAFSLLLFLLPLAPSLYILGLNQDLSKAFADRYAYFPSAGAAVLVAAIVAGIGLRSRRVIFAAVVILTATVPVLASMTVARNIVWHDSLALWTDCVRKSPDVAAAHENLGLALIRGGRECEGRREMREAMRLSPDLPTQSLQSGVLAARKGLTMQAVLSFQTALLYDPDLVAARYNLAVAFQQLGWTEAAIEQYRETLARAPDNADAHNNVGILLAQVQLLDDAIEHFNAAARLRPGDTDVRLNLAHAYQLKGMTREAAEQRAIATGSAPDEPRITSSHPQRRP